MVGWLHGGEEEDDDDEVPIGDVSSEEILTPFHEDTPVAHASAPMSMEFMYQAMIALFGNMSTRFDSLDARMTSLEEDVHAIRHHLLPPSPPHDPNAYDFIMHIFL
ncbi:hypothetical protein V6N12_073722 [Hibiscus sabdariffa]|uniref:Uncharacterized protein n=1 Tax=Hibiscus sabdariffa TaxID=183260 RepID=A0ABR2CTA3_9ROSI